METIDKHPYQDSFLGFGVPFWMALTMEHFKHIYIYQELIAQGVYLE